MLIVAAIPSPLAVQGSVGGDVVVRLARGAFYLFPFQPMENTDFPKVHVIEEWFAGDSMLCVQLVEIALNRKQQLSGAQHGIGLRLADPDGERTVGLIVSPHLAMEMCAALEQALERHDKLTGVK